MGHVPHFDAISGALFTLRIQYEYTHTQCDEGARDGNDIWYIGIISVVTEITSQNIDEI